MIRFDTSNNLLRSINLLYLLTGFIVNSGEEAEMGDNDGDDEADDLLGLGRKRTRLVRNKLASNV
jgi:hypothetical protein